MDDLNLLAYCGLYCGACSFKVAAVEQDRKHLAQMPTKYDHLKTQPLEECRGCRADDRCGDCGIKDCARARGVAHCGECGGFPCSLMVQFCSDGIPHHAEVIGNIQRIRQAGPRQWLEENAAAYACRCGKRLSWYVRDCIHG
jgi:hypothetical protein